jgi:pyruvate/2-oxoglutarate dehydrogenase complex dihydrolipoamide acyltransferase (E2) component
MSYEFRFPDIGEGLTEGKILEFKVEPGAEVVAGDILAIVETDKVVAEIASPRTGVVVRFGSEVGDQIGVGETLAFIDLADGAADADGNGAAASARPNGGHEFQALVGTLDAAPSSLPASDELDVPGEASESALAPAPEPQPADGAAAPPPEGAAQPGTAGAADEPLVTPAARRLARDLGVDLTRVAPDAPGGRIQREDVERAAAAAPPAGRA